MSNKTIQTVQLQINSNPNGQNYSWHLDYVNKYKGMSWAEISYLEEEEEEHRLELEAEKKRKDELEIRRILYAKGEYELEEGEILE